MSYPKLDGGLRLLMLAHLWLEDARGRGKGEPRLEYRADRAALTVRAADAGASHEVRYGDLGLDDVLKSLGDAGLVSLGDADPASGVAVVTITEEGLRRIRHRHAFESNLPRFRRRWEVSLLGHPRNVGVWEEWRANWGGAPSPSRTGGTPTWAGGAVRGPS